MTTASDAVAQDELEAAKAILDRHLGRPPIQADVTVPRFVPQRQFEDCPRS
jgi:hypothetical protein